MKLRRRHVYRVAPYDPTKPLAAPVPPAEVDDSVVLGGAEAAAHLSWLERVHEPHDTSGPRLILDEAYEIAREMLDERSASIALTIKSDGTPIKAGHSRVDTGRSRLVRLTVIGASREDARIWAQRRLGATMWQHADGDIEIASRGSSR
jgi:hypothetical protein